MQNFDGHHGHNYHSKIKKLDLCVSRRIRESFSKFTRRKNLYYHHSDQLIASTLDRNFPRNRVIRTGKTVFYIYLPQSDLWEVAQIHYQFHMEFQHHEALIAYQSNSQLNSQLYNVCQRTMKTLKTSTVKHYKLKEQSKYFLQMLHKVEHN